LSDLLICDEIKESVVRKSYNHFSAKEYVGKSLTITMVFAFLLSGAGHIYLGFTARGIIILMAGIGLGIVLQLLLPADLAIALIFGYKIWQILDVYKLHKKQTEVPKASCNLF
jgi:hypothetical protein